MAKKRLFNDGWEFLKLPLGSAISQVAGKMEMFEKINLPHDWMIYDTDNLYEDSTGWYRKIFHCGKKPGSRYEIYFEGVYMDSSVYVNGEFVGEWKYGYSSFFFDITDYLSEGGENEILVRVNYQSPNTRWYSGAGIYRDVYFTEYPSWHFVTDSLYIVPRKQENGWLVEVSAEIQAEELNQRNQVVPFMKPQVLGEFELVLTLRDGQGEPLAEKKCELSEAAGECTEEGGQKITMQVAAKEPELWSLENPALYECNMRLQEKADKETSIDEVQQKFGFRSFTFDTEKGFFLNGVHTKLNGVCEHHDLGAIGAAFHKSAMERKLRMLREMGVNSIRSTHNMPAVGLLELADEMGFLVIDEAFDMWERPKNPYDYARFFPEWYKKDVASWVRRDRNHPCVLFWSIGNEIGDTHAGKRGQEVTKLLLDEVKKHDPAGNAGVTIGSNYMPWENARKCADILKFAGYNYAEKYYDEHHKEHPDWYIYGSETSSTVQSRGIYHFPYKQSVLADEDEQCSSLGNSTTSWGAKSTEYCIIAERDHAFSMGQFLWTGFDYIGEPTPYHTRNSYFGQIDTAGFPKDSFYLYQAAWTTKPMVHVFPYWDFNPGQLVDVRVCSNAPLVELFLNGRSLGEQQIDHLHGTALTGNWQIPYEPGEITAVAYDGNHKELVRESRHSFTDAVKLVARVEQEQQVGVDAGDLVFVELFAVDKDGNPVENANNRIEVTAEGAGWITGLDNGDSTDEDQYKGNQKRLFSGKMLVILAAGAQPGVIRMSAKSQGMQGVAMTISVKEKELPEGVSLRPEMWRTAQYQDLRNPYQYVVGLEAGRKLQELTGRLASCAAEAADEKNIQKEVQQEEAAQEKTEKNAITDGKNSDDGERQNIWIRKIELSATEGQCFSIEKKELLVTAKLYPENADYSELTWKAVNDAGITSNLASVEAMGNQAKLTALGDGVFRLRCMAKNGTDRVKVISQLEFDVKGVGRACLDPYGFVAGAMYDYFEGEPGNGNEQGVSTARDGRTVIGFCNLDFGSYGSDTITLPIFELGSEKCPIEIWEGIPKAEGATLLAKVVYDKKSIWNTYQEETYVLNRRVKGIKQISFVLNQKIHLKGFSFTEKKAYETLLAAEHDSIYGDQFRICGTDVLDIGNNVTLEFRDMNFNGEGSSQITICGKTKNDKNSIHVCFEEDGNETRQIVEFPYSEDWMKLTFPLEKVAGKKTVRFLFLPGSQFDFRWFHFQA